MIFALTLVIALMMNTFVHAEDFIIPPQLKEMMGLKMTHHGPNCWGTALYLKGISVSPRFVGAAEMTYWQESPLCRALEIDETIEPGDILNVYGPEYTFAMDMFLTEGQSFINLLEPGRYYPASREAYTGFHRLLHSETFVTNSHVFGKESPHRDDAFKITPLTEVYGRPRGSSECQESPILTPHLRQFTNTPRSIRGSKCGYFSKVYRCRDFKELIDFTEVDEYFLSSIEAYQRRIFEVVTSHSGQLSPKERKEMMEFAHTHLAEIKLQILSVQSEQARVFLTWKFFSTYSIMEGIRWLETV